MAESGVGYTLSGKPLDPNSAAARPYLKAGGVASAEGDPANMETPAVAVDASNTPPARKRYGAASLSSRIQLSC